MASLGVMAFPTSCGQPILHHQRVKYDLLKRQQEQQRLIAYPTLPTEVPRRAMGYVSRRSGGFVNPL